jgi:hypothetical protein
MAVFPLPCFHYSPYPVLGNPFRPVAPSRSRDAQDVRHALKIQFYPRRLVIDIRIPPLDKAVPKRKP